MKIKGLFLILFLYLFFSVPVYAEGLPGLVQVCFSTMKRSPQVQSSGKSGFGPNTLTLGVDGIDATEAYIGFCKAGGKDCSTGNEVYDTLLFPRTDLTLRRKDVLTKYRAFDPNDASMIRSKIDVVGGKLENVLIYINQPGNHVDHYIYAFYFKNPPQGAGMGPEVGSNTSLKNADLLFTRDPVLQSGKKCARLAWDPFGRVFDSQTLEPIGGVEIRLLTSLNPERIAESFDPNPQLTHANGTYMLRVNEGDYYIRLKKLPSGYTFTQNPILHPNYSKIYFKKIGDSYSIYKPDEKIIERTDTDEERAQGAPNPEQRDIPLDTTGTRVTSPASFYPSADTLTQFSTPDKGGMQYMGVSTHPFTIIKAVAVLSTGEETEVERIYADAEGDFDLYVASEKIPATAISVKILLEKIDLTRELPTMQTRKPTIGAIVASLLDRVTDLFIMPVEAQETVSQSFEMIPRYLSGYAYDNNHRILPHTRVRTILRVSDTAYSETMSNEEGYFFFDPSDVPANEFYLEFYPGDMMDKGIQKTMTSFLTENKDYFIQSKQNIMSTKTVVLAPTTSVTLPVLQPTVPRQKKILNNTGTQSQNLPLQNEANSQKSAPMNMGMIGMVIFFLALLVVGGVLFYKKRSTQPSNSGF